MGLPSNSKIQIFRDKIIVAATGAVGFSQRLSAHVEEAIAGNVFSMQKRRECVANISQRLLTDFEKSKVRYQAQGGLGFGALVAAVHNDEPFLCEYGTTDFQPEIKDGRLFFVAMGSGQMLAEPFLAFVSRVLWKNTMPNVEHAKFGVYWVLDHAIKLAPGGVGYPIKIAVLRKVDGQWRAEELQEMQEAAEYITGLEDHIGQFTQSSIEEAQSTPPPAPQGPDSQSP